MRSARANAARNGITNAEFIAGDVSRELKRLVELAERPTAVFIASDVVAFGALRAIRERGLRIPQDIAIVGFDDVSVTPL